MGELVGPARGARQDRKAMSSSKLPRVASLRRQQLRLEFASIKTAPPVGIYVSLSPNDPALWCGVLFVQKGPYASAILRFQIRFPPLYPDLPPLVTFSTPIFHPLVVPLTIQTYSNRPSDLDSVTGAVEEQLPPGGFSLRHGFPHWFGPTTSPRATDSGKRETVDTPTKQNESGSQGPTSSVSEETAARIPPTPLEPQRSKDHDDINVTAVALLEYIRSAFDDEAVLSSIPLEAAGYPNAWHAWRAHCRQPQAISSTRNQPNRDGGVGFPSTPSRTLSPDENLKRGSLQARSPGEWNWEGVWHKRVKENIHQSFLESVLFGSSSRTGSTGDDVIRFRKLDHGVLTKIKEDILALYEEPTAEN